ncbi:MAG: biotin carboxylase N-terminal domain-containing protein, partial [Candidatus Puniceispirillaceae bacterium]
MFKKILIANRGEIACRIMATAKKMKIKTVAVYSDADANAPHVQMADEAVHIGAAPSKESYLLGDVIIQAALDSGAEAIHPGYGFLSENAGFVEAVKKAGLSFIGPDVRAISVMGDKIESKALAQSAGVSCVPGTDGA